MKSIRLCVFETNSSSCHCLTVLNKDVFNALKNRTAVIHDKYEAWEGEDIKVRYSCVDLISIKSLHQEFLTRMKELEDEEDRDFLALEKYCFDDYWVGLLEIFKNNINDIEFFRNLVFFNETENNIGIKLNVIQTEENDMNSGSMRSHTPEYVMAWGTRYLLREAGFDFISFTKPFEDINISISDFEEKSGGKFEADHRITC